MVMQRHVQRSWGTSVVMLTGECDLGSCDEFSVSELQRIQIVLFTLGDPELNAVYNATADA